MMKRRSLVAAGGLLLLPSRSRAQISIPRLVAPKFSGGAPTLPTWSLTNKYSDVTISNGGLTATCGGSQFFTESGISDTAIVGKTVFKVVVDAVGGFGSIGVFDSTRTNFATVVGASDSCGLFSDGRVRVNGVDTVTIPGYTDGDEVTVAIDPGNMIWFAINDVFTGDPVAGTGGSDISGISSDQRAAYTVEHQSSAIGQVTITTPPSLSGFTPL